jgi:hypothetical protein
VSQATPFGCREIEGKEKKIAAMNQMGLCNDSLSNYNPNKNMEMKKSLNKNQFQLKHKKGPKAKKPTKAGLTGYRYDR